MPRFEEAAAIKSRSLILTEPARTDLDGIYDYIASDSPEAAERFVTTLVTDMHRIARNGLTGVARDWIRPGLRMHPFGKYCAYFRVADDRLIVLRVLHGARDINAIIFGGDPH